MFAGPLLLALLLDAVAGEPGALWSRMPHPAVLMGRAVAALDGWLNTGTDGRRRGVAALAVLVVAAGAVGWLIAAVPDHGLLEVIGAAILIAQKGLADHVSAVAVALRRSVGEGRRAVAMIVGRDTAAMDPPAVARAAIESGAENLSDGVVAPAFWFLIGGLPWIMIYKIVNTADSMIGHRTPRHEDFGWAAARFDDLLNLIPARLTAGLIVAAHLPPGRWAAAWRMVRRDAVLHRSPNAGWPEAAMAVVLDVALSGPRSYGGRMTDFPFVHPEGRRDPGPEEIARAVGVLWRTWAAMMGAVAVLALLV